MAQQQNPKRKDVRDLHHRRSRPALVPRKVEEPAVGHAPLSAAVLHPLDGELPSGGHTHLHRRYHDLGRDQEEGMVGEATGAIGGPCLILQKTEGPENVTRSSKTRSLAMNIG